VALTDAGLVHRLLGRQQSRQEQERQHRQQATGAAAATPTAQPGDRRRRLPPRRHRPRNGANQAGSREAGCGHGLDRKTDTGVLMASWGVNPAARVLVIGGGFTGQRFANAAAASGARVWLTSRNPPPHTPTNGLTWLRFDPANGVDLTLPEALSHVLVTVPPGRDGRDPVLEALQPALHRQPLCWLGYLSTTGVYGDVDGAWVNEDSPTRPSLPRSQARLACEQQWLRSDLPVQSFRLPAIYGPGRCPFQQLRAGTARLVHKPGQVFCRIHVDDIVGALLHNLSLEPTQRPAVLNVSDNAPCPSSETLGYAAHLLDCKLPPLQRFEVIAPAMSPMALSFWADNRRVSNRRLCQELGYRLRYPSYREGFSACLAEERAAGAGGPVVE
jgi:nucleoside-diphosphate-sugar epimerase